VANDPRFDKLAERVQSLERTLKDLPKQVETTEEFKRLISEAVEDGLRSRSQTKLARLKSWSLPGAAVAIAIFVILQWTAYVEFRTTTNLTFGNIEKRLAGIEGQLAKIVVTSHASLNPAQFVDTLPDLGPSLATLRQGNVSVPRDVVSAIRSQLIATIPNAPGFWPATAELVNYRSPMIPINLRECARTVPEHLTWRPLDHPEAAGAGPPDQVKFSNCHLDLDLPFPASVISPTNTDAVSIVCEHCKITYTGGKVPLLSLRGYVNLIFNDCSFAIRASSDSPERAKRLIAAALTSEDEKSISYTYSE